MIAIPAPASAEIETFPDGTEVEITIDSPADGSSPVAGAAFLEGTARVGAGDTPQDTSLVVVYDLSGSTLQDAGGDCGGDVNGDGQSNTILDCEIAAMEALEQTAVALGSVAEMGVTLFELSSQAADVQPASGIQRLTVPGADLNGNGITDIAEVVRTSRWVDSWFSADARVSLFTSLNAGSGNGGTNYSAGLSKACETLAATSQPNRTIVFLSDGGANRGTDVTTVLPYNQPAIVHSVAVGAGSTCANDPSGLGSLQEVADLTGGTCTEVTSPEDLPDILSGIISPEIYSLGLSINGGPETDISSSTSVVLPARGPDPLDWSYNLEGLSGPIDEVCVTVYARRDLEHVQATECITLISDRPPIADAGADQIVSEGSLVEIDGSGSYDPDGDPVSYEWSIISQVGAPIVLTSTTEPVAAFIAFDDGEYELALTVSDGRTAVTDTTVIAVTNEAPVAQALAEPAAEGGVALVTASFTDAGLLDTHSATIDWGDASGVHPIEISAQGNGWGSLFGTHVYGGPGTFTATITITDDDGGAAVVESVGVEVSDSLALWANSETARRTINWVGGVGTVEGLVHSNNELRIRGDSKVLDGRVEHVGSNSSGAGAVFLQPPVVVAPADYPVEFPISDYAPGGRAAIDAGSSYFDMSGECGRRWDPAGPLQSGLYYVPCDVKLNAAALAGSVTIVATGAVQISGAEADFSPFIDGLLFSSASPSDKAVQISSSDSTFLGYIFARTGRVDLSGSGNTYLCGILADRLDIADDELKIRASDCIRPQRTVAPPSLVPELGLQVDASPESVLPGTTVDVTTTVTNNGSLLLVPGVVGVENLGTADVTVSGITLGIEYLPVGGSWTPLAESVSVTAMPNPAPGVTFPAAGDFAGTVVGPDGLATWGAEIQVFLPAATVQLLLDDTQVIAVRNTFDVQLANPTSEPVRNLFRFGNDFAEELRTLGSSLGDVKIVATAVDGTTALIDSDADPALGTLAAGESASVMLSSVVPVPEQRGAIEPVAAYGERLGALDNTELGGSAFALASGGVGTVLGPFGYDTVVRHVPIAQMSFTGSEILVAGETANYELEFRNTGSAPALTVSTSIDIDEQAQTVSGFPSELAPGVIETVAFERLVPSDEPVGFVVADASTLWQDANGNLYGDLTARVSTEVGTPPELSALLADEVFVDADGTGVPSPGDTIRYSATITNRGSNPATGVIFAVAPDPASTLTAGSVVTNAGTVSTGNGAADAAVEVLVGSIDSMASVEITFDVVIESGATLLSVQGVVASDVLPNTATDDPGESGFDDPTTTRIIETPPSLQAVLVGRLGVDADGDGFIGAADTVEYASQLTNSGLTAATGVTLTIEPDVNTELVVGSVTSVNGVVTEGNNASDSRVVVTFSSVSGLAQEMVEYRVTVNDPVPTGVSQIVTQGTVSSIELADALTDDPTTSGSADPTALGVVVISGGTGGTGGTDGNGNGAGATNGPASTFEAVTPPEGEAITSPVQITADITPPDTTTIESWEVVAYPVGSDFTTGIVLNSGIGQPPSGALATFDPSVVSNGTWTIIVRATNSDGGVGVSETSVTVEGALKLGRYALSYEDSSVSVGGIPLQVIRTYDTLTRTSTEDFGYGWSLDVANFEVATNQSLGLGPWAAESCGGGLIFVPLCFTPEDPRVVNVTWPTGRVESFDLRPTGNTFLSILMSAEYEARPGATSTLRPAPGTETGWLANGSMTDGFFGSGDIYNPQRFLLTADDGTEYLLDKTDGLILATDRYGNTVSYTDDGVSSSLGPELTFDRDAEGRIIGLTEPTGDSVTYTYDAAGDLVSVLDQESNDTTFTYDNGHFLTVIDDAGPGPYRTLNYGPDGRVESITDAEGNTTAISIDLDSRSQVVTEPDGNSTRVTAFDERGNATTIDHVYDGESHITNVTYDENDKVTSRTDPNGNIWQLSWDDSENLTSYIDPTGATTAYVYGDFSLPTAITDALGNERTFKYDTVGNLIEVRHPAGSTSGNPASPYANGSPAIESFGYDAAGNMTSMTDPLGAVWQWNYDAAGNLVEAIDPLGLTTTYTYDALGRNLSETDPLGAVTGYSYDSNGNLVSMTDPLGRVVSWTYDDRDQVTERIDQLGFITSYTYDDTGNLTSETDPTSRTWYWDHEHGRVTTVTAPDGGITAHNYDAAGRLASIADPLGRTLTYGYDDAGRWTSTTYPYGDASTGVVSQILDDAGYQVGYVDGVGETWLFERDPLSRVVSSTTPLGEVWETNYDAVGRMVSGVDPLGNVEAYSWDAAGQLVESIAPDGGVSSYGYDVAGAPISQTDPLNRTTSYSFDGAYRSTVVTDALGNTFTDEYDLAGQVTKSTSFTGVVSEYQYDPRGQLESITDGLGNVTAFAYDASGRTEAITDARGSTTQYGYDTWGRPSLTTDVLGGTAAVEYDLVGQVTGVVDPTGDRRIFGYDDAGLLVTQSDGLGRSWQFTHDAEGRQISSLDPRGVLIEFGYDAAGQLLSETGPDETVTFGYDAAGRTASMLDATGTTAWTYDPVSRVSGVTSTAGDVGYSYDLAGQTTTMTQPEGVSSYQYDPLGFMNQATTFSGEIVGVVADPDGRLASITRPNGVTTSHSFDLAGRLDSVVHTDAAGPVASYDYTLDPNGNRTSLATLDDAGSRTESYTYDPLNRLTFADYGDGVTETFGYDAAGSRISHTVAGGPSAGSTSYIYDAAQQLQSVTDAAGTASLIYDASGNVLDDGRGSEFSWDQFGRMTAATVDGVSGSVQVVTATRVVLWVPPVRA